MAYYMELRGTMVSGQEFITYRYLGEIEDVQNFSEDDRMDLYTQFKNYGFIKIPLDDEGSKFFDTKLIESIELIGPLSQDEVVNRMNIQEEN